MARHAGVELAPQDWVVHGHDIPLLANVQPAGNYLGERFHRAGGVPAIMWELQQAGLLDETCLTVTGRTIGQKLAGRESRDREVIRPSPTRSRPRPASSCSAAICSTWRS